MSVLRILYASLKLQFFCEFTLQIKTSKLRSVTVPFQLTSNVRWILTFHSLQTVWEIGHWKPLCWWCACWVQGFIHSYLALNWISTHTERKKNGKRKNRISESNKKSREHKYKSASFHSATKYQKSPWFFFLAVNHLQRS